jgi:hypothetical protein
MKFKNYQRVVAIGFLINGERRDVNSMVEGFDLRSNKYWVNVNSVVVLLPEDRLEDFNEYWTKKNGESK